MRTLLWFRGKDLRLADHEALCAALSSKELIPVFVLDPYFFSPERARELPHRMQFLLESLCALREKLSRLGSRLLLIKGKSTEVIPQLAERWRVDRVFAQRWTEPFGRERDQKISERLRVPFLLFDGETLAPPGSLRTLQGAPYSVFTPFARAFFSQVTIARPKEAPTSLPPLPKEIVFPEESLPEPEPHNPRLLPGGEEAAQARLEDFIEGAGSFYAELRDRVDLPGTSRLSADIKFGTLSPRQIWSALEERLSAIAEGSLQKFLTELVWREFAYATLWDRPSVLQRPFKPEFEGFPWRQDEAGFLAWSQGKTGYPIVDAAARQLLQEGFIHNRARMISASFLTKHLMIDYRRGEAHFLKYLTDGDWAQNNMGWQWSAGCGCDAQPYFRIFHPVSQAESADPLGDYVRRYVPELAGLPTRYLHRPWEAPPFVLQSAGVVLSKTYPAPIVEHTLARNRFLESARRHLKSAAREAA